MSLGLDLSAFIDVDYYRSLYGRSIADTFGENATSAEIVDFVFGNAAPYIDETYFKALNGQNLTADGRLVADLSREELVTYALTEGYESDLQLSPFDLEAYRVQFSSQLTTFYEVSNVASLSQQQIFEFATNEGWKLGIDLSNFTDAMAIEFFRETNAAAIARRYQIDLSAVSELDAAVILDFQYGGASQTVDFNYFRETFSGDISATFGVTSAFDISDAQILEYVYTQNTEIQTFNLTPIDFRGYARRYASQIATELDLSVSEVLQLDNAQIEAFIFSDGARLGLSLQEFVNVEYVRSTYSAAISTSLGISQSAVANLGDADIASWFASSDARDVDVEFLRYQIESLTVGQQAKIFASLGLDFDATASLSTELVLQIAFSSAFQEVVEADNFSLSAIDVEGYVRAHVSELYEFYFGSEVSLSVERSKKKTRRTARGSRITAKTTKRTKRTKRTLGTKGKKTKRTFKDVADTFRTLKTGKTTKKTVKVKTTKKTKKTDVSVVTPTVEVEIDVQFEAVQQLTREQVVEFMFGRGVKLGIDVSEFVQVDFLRNSFEAGLLQGYGVSSTLELDDRLVVDFVYGGLSSELDFSFYREQYASELQAEFGLSIDQITDTLILEHAYTVGLESDLALSPIDSDELVLAQSNAEVTGESVDLSEFVDVDYLQQTYDSEIVSEYRVGNVYNVSQQQTIDFLESGGQIAGINYSAAIDTDFYLETYAEEIDADFAVIDANADDAIDEIELFDYITGAGLEQGQNPSKLVDFESYRDPDSASAQALLAFYNVESIEEVSFRQTLEYMFTVGLEAGFAPSSDLDLEAIRTEFATEITAFFGASSVSEVTLTQTFNYAFGEGFDRIGSQIAA